MSGGPRPGFPGRQRPTQSNPQGSPAAAAGRRRPSATLCAFVPSVCRLWRECARRVLRTQRQVTWISAGLAGAGHLEEHCLLRVVAQEIEASDPGWGTRPWQVNLRMASLKKKEGKVLRSFI